MSEAMALQNPMPDDHPQHHVPAVGPVTKKRKTSISNNQKKGNGTSKAGSLKFILEVPMEIVYEILGHLEPIDILHLSEVNKELHSKLTAPSSDLIWATARKNILDLPERPVDFTESAYARFVFRKTCQACGGLAHGLEGMAFVRIRLCSKCHTKMCTNTRKENEVLGSFGLLKLVPAYGPHNGSNPQSHTFIKVLRPILNAVLHKLHSFNNRKEEQAYRLERCTYINAVTEHAFKLDNWLKKTREESTKYAVLIRQGRLNVIRAKLIELGHSHLDVYHPTLTFHRAVAKTAELTERSWTNLRPQLEQLLELIKTGRLQKEHMRHSREIIIQQFRHLWNGLSSDLDRYTYIPVQDFLECPTVSRLCQPDVHHDELVERFKGELHSIKREVEDARAEMRRDLLWEIARGRPAFKQKFRRGFHYATTTNTKPPVDPNVLSLATSVFRTRWGAQVISPIHYATLFKRPILPWDEDTFDVPGAIPGTQPFLTYEWLSYRMILEYDHTGSLAMEQILARAGLDPRTATYEELESLSTARSGPFENKSWREMYTDIIPGTITGPITPHPADDDEEEEDEDDEDDN